MEYKIRDRHAPRPVTFIWEDSIEKKYRIRLPKTKAYQDCWGFLWMNHMEAPNERYGRWIIYLFVRKAVYHAFFPLWKPPAAKGHTDNLYLDLAILSLGVARLADKDSAESLLYQEAYKSAATHRQHVSLKRRDFKGSEGLAYCQGESSTMGSDPEGMVHQPGGELYQPEADNLAGISPDDLLVDYFYSPTPPKGDSCDDTTTNAKQESMTKRQNS